MNIQDIYKQQGHFTHEQNCEVFIKPTQEVLNTIIQSDDMNFRKECLKSIIDYNPDIIQFLINNGNVNFLTNSIIKETLKSLLSKSE
jgi:hypothetical protein